MATYTSANGAIKINDSADAVAEVTGYSVTWTSDTTEDTVIGDAARTYKATLKSYTASIDCMWDDTDTNGQDVLVPGASITYELFPNGDTSTYAVYSGSGIVTSLSISGSVGEMITATIEVQGTCDLTPGTVS